MRRRILIPLLAGDLLALFIGFAGAARIVFDAWAPWHAPLHGEDSIWSLLGLMVTGLFVGSYVSVRMGGITTRRPTYGRAVVIVVVALFVTMTGIVVTRGYWSRTYLGWTAVVWLLGSLLLRFALRRRKWAERVVMVTDDEKLVADLEQSEHIVIVQVLDPVEHPPNGADSNSTLALDARAILSDEMAQFVTKWSLSGRGVRSLSSVYEQHLGRIPLVHIAHGWELTAPVERNEYEPLKRFIDLVLVVVTAPFWLLLAGPIWLAIRLNSPGDAIYAQTRVGRHGKLFTLYKFRTMVKDAEEDGPQFALPSDPRLTRVGRILRRFRLDEMPQLWCVLKGDLSLIGPRPERPYFAKQFEHEIPFFAYRTLVRPGVTGWAQVNYGYADDVADTVEKLTFDLFYVKHMSIWLDMQILGRSVWTVMSGFGAQ